ncbi:hypothetical protein H4F33_21630, partial [Pectobacterium brasiliense]|nr:hypothetical protein [Pectobacterium brasiliense]
RVEPQGREETTWSSLRDAAHSLTFTQQQHSSKLNTGNRHHARGNLNRHQLDVFKLCLRWLYTVQRRNNHRNIKCGQNHQLNQR